MENLVGNFENPNQSEEGVKYKSKVRMSATLSKLEKKKEKQMNKIFVQLTLGGKSSDPTQVSTQNCTAVDDFKLALKAAFPRKLKNVDVEDIYLFEADGTKISPLDLIGQLKLKKTPLGVVVEPQEPQVQVVAQKPFISLSRHQDYKLSKAHTSSRSYLTSVALELDEIYPIVKETSPTGKEKPLTFGTIIHNAYRHNPDPFPKFQSKYPKLNDFFTVSEWNFLDALNDAVNGHLHLPLNPDSSTKLLILPSDFSGGVAICQRIATKSNVVSEPSHLVVKNEGSISGGSPDSEKGF